ncbi:MAG: proton-conducting transporter membrane subunit [Acetobacteraceae bacterium]|nr:proton-conducting transporter membrane subunit [Acetobacteraceae bacterium]
MIIAALAPFPVVLPLGVGALLLGVSKHLPRRGPDVLAILTAAATSVICGLLARSAAETGPITYWFGQWHLLGDQVVGISFVIDLASAGVGALVGFLFAATLVFAWGFFEEVHAHFHVIMLVFMAGMVGFCLTGDLINMFVWFELMSVAGFAATGFALRSSAIAGALNFTIVNTVGAYVFLAGIGLLYGQGGALDMVALGRSVAAHPNDPVMALGFVLIASALLTKAAQLPFQMWLGDAHAVAPSPVSVIFSGAMVSIGLFGLAKLGFRVFGGAPEIVGESRRALLVIGLASAVVGAMLALGQRHIKRLLAFSTISHAGIMLTGLSQMSQDGEAGLLAYLFGHGLVKGAMFMLAGFIAAKCGGIDEITLRGRGRDYWPVGIMMALGGLALAGLPFGPMDEGFKLIEHGAADAGQHWIATVLLVSATLTGAAVLRVAGRIFGGWGELSGDERHGETEEEQEPGHQPAVLLAGPAALLLGLGLIGWDDGGALASRAAAALIALPEQPAPALPGSPGPWIAVLCAVAITGFELARRHLPHWFVALVEAFRVPPTRVLQRMQSGLVTDYVTWLAVGLAVLATAFVFAV